MNPPENLLGLAQSAGKIASGDTACRYALTRGDGELLIVAVDAGNSVSRSLQRLAQEKDVPCIEWGEKSQLGAAIGKPPRAVLVLTDAGFARSLVQRLTEVSDGRKTQR